MQGMFAAAAAALVMAPSPSASQVSAPVSAVDLGFLVGDWELFDAGGQRVGSSRVSVQAPGAMLFEERAVGDGAPQPLWFVNSERDGGWVQMFVGPKNQARVFTGPSPQSWPLELGSDVTLVDGSAARFRLTMQRIGPEGSRRVLLMSRDKGASWKPIFDYEYRRKP